VSGRDGRRQEDDEVAASLPTGDTGAQVLEDADTRLIEVVDSLLERGVMLTGDVVLGLADVDLIYLKLSALLAAADRVLRRDGGDSAPGGPGEGEACVPSRAATTAPSSPAGSEPTGAVSTSGARVEAADPEALRTEIEARGRDAEAEVTRWNPEPDDVERSVAKLVLTLVDFVRQLMERQAIRRMEEDTLTPEEVERLGSALMRLEETLLEIAARFGLGPEDLNLDLGPLGTLT
jgi:hypothetical protein